MEIKISQDQLTRFASHSLLGALALPMIENKDDKTIKILFEQNRELKYLTCLSVLPFCLIDDILFLVEEGYKIEVGQYVS